MNELIICPACLSELPDDYPYDHVAIDRAVAGDRPLFVAMSTEERSEVVSTGLSRGATLLDLVNLLSWPFGQLQAVLPDEHPESTASRNARVEQQVRQLWAQGLRDVTISARTGLNPSKVGRVRKRLGLATKVRTNAERRAVWA